MNILITGGAGYIGAELAKNLAGLKQVDRILIYDNLSRKQYSLFLTGTVKSKKIHFVKGDTLDSRTLIQSMEGVDTVYHLAANVSTPFASQDPHFFEQVNHWGTADLMYAIEESQVKRLIFTSSTSVYGASEKEVGVGDSPNPKTFYGISKLRAEEQIARLLPSDNHQIFILRCGNVYGFSPGMRFDAVINRFMFEANYIGKIAIHGKGYQTRAFIPINKLTSLLSQFTKDHVPPSGIYDLVDKNLSILEVARTIRELYPELEMQFINQHLSLRELKVRRDKKLHSYFPLPESSLLDDLKEFKEAFAF
jgi:UDP-glucose 4-epimerase